MLRKMASGCQVPCKQLQQPNAPASNAQGCCRLAEEEIAKHITTIDSKISRASALDMFRKWCTLPACLAHLHTWTYG